MLHYSILIFMIYIYPALSHRHPHSHQVQPPYFMHKSINLHPWTLFPLHVTCSLSFPASPRSVDLSPLQIRSLSLINKMPALSIRHFQTESTAPICCPPFPFVGFRSSLTRDKFSILVKFFYLHQVTYCYFMSVECNRNIIHFSIPLLINKTKSIYDSVDLVCMLLCSTNQAPFSFVKWYNHNLNFFHLLIYL